MKTYYVLSDIETVRGTFYAYVVKHNVMVILVLDQFPQTKIDTCSNYEYN